MKLGEGRKSELKVPAKRSSNQLITETDHAYPTMVPAEEGRGDME